ncbi:hypothetical protein MN0502_11240 [Arthrobacter sp. MN05-02]|nr:hypothetical protein MN0502_11240 [Arthrobacter sp. MN05-02]
MADGVGALAHGQVHALAVVRRDAEVGRFPRSVHEALERGFGEGDERFVAEGLRSELHHAEPGPVGAEHVTPHEARPLECAQQTQGRRRRQVRLASGVRERQRPGVADRPEEDEGPLDGAGRGFCHGRLLAFSPAVYFTY